MQMSSFDGPKFKEAVYIESELEEYADNPLISALPPIMSPIEVVQQLSRRPTFKKEEIELGGHIRVHAISRLTRSFFVPQTVHLLLEQKLSQLIRKSYLGRNPKHAAFKQKLNEVKNIITNQDLTTYVHDVVDSTASSMAISGISGAGKSTATNNLLNTYDRVLYHPEYHILQVPWIKVDCPYDGSLAEFCESFFIALDKRLNTNYRKKYTSGKPRIGQMIANVANLCLIHAIGLVVIDEFQHMNLAKSGGEKKMINFLVTLVNVVEVSIVLIGTPTALRLFASEFRQARRASGEGSIVWDRLPLDENWDDFVKELWQYQWLKSPGKLDEVMINELYEISQGVPDILVKLFCLAQARAILLANSPEDECLSVELLRDVFEEELSIVKPMLDALNSKDRTVLEQCSDIVIPKIEGALLNTFDHLKAVPLNKKANVELGEASQSDVANSAIQTLMAMGINEDIVRPLVLESVNNNPEVTLIQIIHHATSSLSGLNHPPANKAKKVPPKYVSKKAWGSLDDHDLRKLYASKSGTMYEQLCDEGFIFPVQNLMVS